jgi:GNAT superfamily N-acetyltransferase
MNEDRSFEPSTNDLDWVDHAEGVDWEELSELYRLAPLGEKPPQRLATVFGNSMFSTFVYSENRMIGAGRALGDGVDCAYIADVAVHPAQQGIGLGATIINRLIGAARGHKKIILYANPGTESFYGRLGFLRMTTAMAIWQDPAQGIEAGVLAPNEPTDL